MSATGKGFVDPAYLRLVAEVLEPLMQRSFASMQVGAGQRVLDVGSGTGIATVSLAERVGPAGEVTGVDSDPAMIALANQRAADAGVDDRVRHLCANAVSLPFEANAFDACRSERLFQHLPEPERALSEMLRVTRPGGRVVVLDTDWGTASVDSTDKDVERRLMRFLTERMHHNGYSGRRLHRMFTNAAMANVTVEAFPVPVVGSRLVRQVITADRLEREALAAGIVTDDELRRWRASLERADSEGGCFFSAALMLAQGTKSARS